MAVSSVPRHPDVARVETPRGLWRVRRLPETTTAERLGFVHASLAEMHAAGIEEIPVAASLPGRDDTILILADRLFDAQRWLPGTAAAAPRARGDERADVPATLTDPLFDEVAAVLARCHTATERPVTGDGAVGSLNRMADAVRRTWEAHRAALRPVVASTPAVQRWVRVGERVLPAASATIAGSPALSDAADVVTHHGLWPARILVDGDRVRGLVGWDETAVGSPLIDLAQLAGRLRGWDAETAERTLVAYGSVRPLSPELRRVLPAVVALDLVAEAGRLLVLAFVPRSAEAAPPAAALRAGAQDLLQSLERIAAVVAKGDAPDRPVRRAWRHRPRPADAPRRPSRRPR